MIDLNTANGRKRASKQGERFRVLREQMVENQIAARSIKDPLVLAAMYTVPRHLFVPEESRALAYDDGPLPIGDGQTISQPYIVALMTELLQLPEDGKVLEIGTGSGYQAAVLAAVVSQVYSIETIARLKKNAERVLKSLGCKNVHLRHGDGYFGWPNQAPYDGIIVTAAGPEIPEPLLEQLAEGGRLVMPVGNPYAHQVLKVVTKHSEHNIEIKDIIPVSFVPLTH